MLALSRSDYIFPVMAALTLNLNSISNLSRSQFRQIASDNPEMKLERNKQGNLIVMAPTGGETGNCNSELNLEIGLWNRWGFVMSRVI